MNLSLLRRRALAAALMLLCGSAVATEFAHPGHAEFNATLDAP